MSGPVRALFGLATVSLPGAWLATINVRAVSGHRVRWWVEAFAALMLTAGVVELFRGIL